MTHILILTPYEASRNPIWRETAQRLADAAIAECSEFTFTHALHDPGSRPDRPVRRDYSNHAAVRNTMLDLFLRPEHTHVLWIDSDLIAYPADLPRRLMAMAPDGLAAPLVTLEDQGEDRHYDIAGFIEREGGPWSRVHPPWFDQPGPVVELVSVGCCYLACADIYRAGARYAHTDGYVEHYAVGTFARAMGRPVRADTRIRAVHGWLPKYGEENH